MKKKSFSSRRAIPLFTYTSHLSAKRLQKIQKHIEDSSLDGILAILGIDSRYNDGCLSFANYLLFGFYNLSPQLTKESDLSEEDLEDLIVLVRRSSVAVYCNPALLDCLLPYIAHWRNLQLHCLTHHHQGEVNEDEKEEFKIRSFADMLDGLSDIGVPYWTKPGLFASKRSVSEFSKLAIEKWPVIQAYAIEGVGKGQFFTMRFNVTGVHERMLDFYGECDPAELERALTESYPLLERHWEHTLSLVTAGGDRRAPARASLDVTVAEVEEPLSSYFSHGRLSSASYGGRAASKHDLCIPHTPFVRFGVGTRNFDDNSSSSATLANSGNDARALHMVIHGIIPSWPISCCRTYFISPSDDNAKRDLDILVGLYRECVRACRKAIADYCVHFDCGQSLRVANKFLSNACLSLSPDANYGSQLEVCDNSGRIVSRGSGKHSFYLKKCWVSIENIHNPAGKRLGSVCFAETFIDSEILSSDPSFEDRHTCLVVTSSIPCVIQWPVESVNLRGNSSTLVALKEVWFCTDITQFKGEVEVFSDGSIFIRARFLPPVFISISAVKSYQSYRTSLPNSVSLLQVLLKSSADLPQVLHTDHKLNFAIAFCPHSNSWNSFSTTVASLLAKRPDIFSEASAVQSDFVESYEFLQRQSMWRSGSSHRTDEPVSFAMTNSSLQPQLSDFIEHYSASYVLSEEVRSKSDVDAVLGRVQEAVPCVAPTKPHDQKISVTVVCGLPGSCADRLCSSLVALHKERVRWVVLKVRSRDGDACLVDSEHLQNQLAELVMKRRSVRPGVASMKRLRIIIEASGFFDIRDVVVCVTQHRDQAVVGAITTCVDPLSCHIEHHLLFPNALQQCAEGLVNNVLFTGPLDNIKDENLASMQVLIRNVNRHAAFLLAAGGQVTRTADFDLILSENSFESTECRAARCLSLPSLSGSGPPWPKMQEVKIEFSQPLLRGSFYARLRSLKNTLLPSPYTGNIYAVKGLLAFFGPSNQIEESTLCFVSKTGNLQVEAILSSGVSPTPPAPPSKNRPINKPYYLCFYGVGLSEDKLRDWLKKSGRQVPSKKCLKTRNNLSSAERKKIQTQRQHDPLPEGIFFNGSQYCSLVDNSKSYDHPCLDRFIDEYLLVENAKIEEFNRRIDSQLPPDLFA